MATSIGKLSKSFFVKLLVGIIILPFVFWGMGDVFRGGNQNVIATIDSKKVSTQEFVNHLQRLNLNEEQIKNLPRTDLMEKILAEYIGRKVMALEIEQSGITVNDNSLRNIIKNDKLFFKNDKFSRTEYEKFLLESNVTAPTFEKNIVEQESRRQFLSSLAGGITIPDILVENAFKRENQTKTIRYIDLEKYHLSKKPSKEKIKEVYNKNKNLFVEKFKSIQYAEISPKAISESLKYDKVFFQQLDVIENKVLDGQSFKETSKKYNLLTISTTEDELLGIGGENAVGFYACMKYFQSQENPNNQAFVKAFKEMWGDDSVIGDVTQAAYLGPWIWKAAVEKAGSFDIDKVHAAHPDIELPDAPEGYVRVHETNQHLYSRAKIGKIRKDGQFDVMAISEDLIEPDPFPEGYQ